MKNDEYLYYLNHTQDEREFMERNWNHVERVR